MPGTFLIHLTSRAQKDFKKLDRQIQQKISDAIFSLETDRHPRQFKALVGHEIAHYRLRVGDYRILYDVYDDDSVVLVLRIGHRKDIYR